MIIITLPDHDILTSYLSAWSEEILIGAARKAGIETLVSKGVNASRSHVTSNISSKNPDMIFFNGHGSSKEIMGQNNEPIITLGINDSLLKGKIVHALACDCGRELGKHCNAKAFIGYWGKWWLCMDQFSLTRPLKDKYAEPVVKSALEAPKQLLKGTSPKEAFVASQTLYQKWIDEFTHSESKYSIGQNYLEDIIICPYYM